MSDELRERVRTIVNRWPHTATTAIADAAIALIRDETLEEAARECGLSSVGLHFAAAIRAMKDKP